jgi:hypothetical protein
MDIAFSCAAYAIKTVRLTTYALRATASLAEALAKAEAGHYV